MQFIFLFELQHPFNGLAPICCFETLQASLENLVVLRFLKLQCNATLYYEIQKPHLLLIPPMSLEKVFMLWDAIRLTVTDKGLTWNLIDKYHRCLA